MKNPSPLTRDAAGGWDGSLRFVIVLARLSRRNDRVMQVQGKKVIWIAFEKRKGSIDCGLGEIGPLEMEKWRS